MYNKGSLYYVPIYYYKYIRGASIMCLYTIVVEKNAYTLNMFDIHARSIRFVCQQRINFIKEINED